MAKDPKTQELLLFSLILSPLLVTAQDGSKSCAADLIIVISVLFLVLAAFVGYYIRRYGNGCLGASTESHLEQAAAVKGLLAAAVESLPSIRFTEIKMRKIGEVELECAVCLCEFTDHEILKLLPGCCHVFHSDCIKPWLSSHVTCPVCRTNLTEVSSLSPVNMSTVLDRISRTLSSKPPEDDDHHITVDIDEGSPISNLRTNWISTRGGERLPRSHSTGELVVRVEENSNTRTMMREMCPKREYRLNKSKSSRWNCFSPASKFYGLPNHSPPYAPQIRCIN